MTDYADFFNELLFGAGAWIGFVLIVGIMLLITFRIKGSGVIFVPASILLGVMYLDNISASSNFMWAALLMFLVATFILIQTVNELKQ